MASFEKLNTENVRRAAKGAILILPVGATEQHGPHLPLMVDTEIPIRIASMMTQRLNAIVAPAIPYGARSLPHTGGGPAFPGSINIRGSIFTEYLKDVIAGYVAAGFRSIVILNGHYENESFIFEAIELCRQDGILKGTKLIATGWWSLVSDEVVENLFGDRFPGWHAEHASACETSLMLHFRSDLVGGTRMDNATPPKAGIYLFPANSAKITNRGVLGSSSLSSAAIGHALCEEICSQLAGSIYSHMGIGRSRKKGSAKNRR